MCGCRWSSNSCRCPGPRGPGCGDCQQHHSASWLSPALPGSGFGTAMDGLCKESHGASPHLLSLVVLAVTAASRHARQGLCEVTAGCHSELHWPTPGTVGVTAQLEGRSQCPSGRVPVTGVLLRPVGVGLLADCPCPGQRALLDLNRKNLTSRRLHHGDEIAGAFESLTAKNP